MNTQKVNSLPIVEDDTIFKIDENDKKIKIATTLIGEINHIPSSTSTKDGEISVMWHSDYTKQQIPIHQASVLENRCDVGMSVCSLVEPGKYGICVKKRMEATCVVLEEESIKYLLSVDTERLRSYSDMNYDLCFYKNSIYEVSDINYAINLIFRDQLNVEISTTKRNFMKRFNVVKDSFNRSFEANKARDINISNKCPMSFDEMIGKTVSIKSSELLKFKNNIELKKLINLIEESNEGNSLLNEQDNIGINNKRGAKDVKKQNETITIADMMGYEKGTNKENKPMKIHDYFDRDLDKLASVNRDKQITFTVSDIRIGEVIVNCIKDFTGSSNDQDFKTEKIKAGEQLDKVKFFKINDKNVELGSRWKLDLTGKDKLVNFKAYEDYVDSNVKAKLMNLPKKPKNLDLSEYKVEICDCYEKESISSVDRSSQSVATPKENNREDRTGSLKSFSKLDNSFVIVDLLDEDDVFLEENQQDSKQLSKEELRNQNLMMLACSNRRSRNTSSRTSSLINSSFKKVKLGSSNEDYEEKEKTVIKKDDRNDQNETKTVLVDVLYVDTFVDVHWQDNTIQTNIPLSHVGEEIDNLIQKFYPGHFVDFTGENKELIPTYGIVQKVDQSSNIAQIKWFYEVANNEEQSKNWITNESLFNLRSSCVHFHLNDVIVCSDLINNFTNTSIEDIPRLIGTIKHISTEGQGLIAWIDGTETWRKLVELVSFFDVEFSDYSDDEDSISSIDSNENSNLSGEWSSTNESSKQKFTTEYKFNKFKFEYINVDLNVTFTLHQFKEKWLKKVEKLFSFVDEFRDIHVDQLNKQLRWRPKTHSEDRKIVDLNFEIAKSYFIKIRKCISNFALNPEDKNSFENFYLQLVFCLNTWIDVIQTNFHYLFILLDENIGYRTFDQCSNSSILTSKDLKFNGKEPNSSLLNSVVDNSKEQISKQEVFDDYKQRMTVLIKKFNFEVLKRLNFGDADLEDDSKSNMKSNIIPGATSRNDNEQNDLSVKFSKLDCLSLARNKIKHELSKSTPQSANQSKSSKLNISALQKEINLLRQNLPESGIYFRTFEDRVDLFSLMIEGPKDTVYENQLFLFDLRIAGNMQGPPVCVYLSFGKKQINPNLYTDGNVCLSLLNTFFSKSPAERWQANKSSLLQLALSLQALVLNSNPFYNEADFNSYCGTVEGRKKSKLYNEFVIINLIDYCIDLMRKRNDLAFQNEIFLFYKTNAYKIYQRYFDFIRVSMKWNLNMKSNAILTDEAIEKKFNEMIEQEFPTFENPTYVLLPASEGFCLTLAQNLKIFISFFKDHLPLAEIKMHEKQIEDMISLIKV